MTNEQEKLTATQEKNLVDIEIQKINDELALIAARKMLESKKLELKRATEPSFIQVFQAEINNAWRALNLSDVVEAVELGTVGVAAEEGIAYQDRYIPFYIDNFEKLKMNHEFRRTYIETAMAAYRHAVKKMIAEAGITGPVKLIHTPLMVDINYVPQKVSWLVNIYNSIIVTEYTPLVLESTTKARNADVS